jgi:hypothetical protein
MLDIDVVGGCYSAVPSRAATWNPLLDSSACRNYNQSLVCAATRRLALTLRVVTVALRHTIVPAAPLRIAPLRTILGLRLRLGITGPSNA